VFFFQAEDGIRDFHVTGVQTCALPIYDEWQTETPNNVDLALQIAKMKADSLREVGEDLKLNCPLAGSYWNDDDKDYTIATNWSRSEERRVGKECRSRWSTHRRNKKRQE